MLVLLLHIACLAGAFSGRQLQKEYPTEFYNHLLQSFWPVLSEFAEKVVNDVLSQVVPVPNVEIDISITSEAPEINNLRTVRYTEHNRCGDSMHISFDSAFSFRGNIRPLGFNVGFEVKLPSLPLVFNVHNFRSIVPLFHSATLGLHEPPEVKFRLDDDILNWLSDLVNAPQMVQDAFNNMLLTIMVQKSLEFRVNMPQDDKNIALIVVEPIKALVRALVARPSVHRRPLAVLRLQNNPELSTTISGLSEKIPAGGGNAVILADFDEEISQKMLTIHIDKDEEEGEKDEGKIRLDSFRDQATHSVEIGSKSVQITGCIGRVVQDVSLMDKGKSGYLRLQLGSFDVGTLTEDDIVDVRFTDGTTVFAKQLASIFKRQKVKPLEAQTRLDISESFLWPVKNVDKVSLTITVARAGIGLKSMKFTSQTLIKTALSAEDDGSIVDLYLTEDSCGKPRSNKDASVPISSTCQIGPPTLPVTYSRIKSDYDMIILIAFLILLCVLLCCTVACISMYRSQKRTLQAPMTTAYTPAPPTVLPVLEEERGQRRRRKKRKESSRRRRRTKEKSKYEKKKKKKTEASKSLNPPVWKVLKNEREMREERRRRKMKEIYRGHSWGDSTVDRMDRTDRRLFRSNARRRKENEKKEGTEASKNHERMNPTVGTAMKEETKRRKCPLLQHQRRTGKRKRTKNGIGETSDGSSTFLEGEILSLLLRGRKNSSWKEKFSERRPCNPGRTNRSNLGAQSFLEGERRPCNSGLTNRSKLVSQSLPCNPGRTNRSNLGSQSFTTHCFSMV